MTLPPPPSRSERAYPDPGSGRERARRGPRFKLLPRGAAGGLSARAAPHSGGVPRPEPAGGLGGQVCWWNRRTELDEWPDQDAGVT